jgi:hypothetical protein
MMNPFSEAKSAYTFLNAICFNVIRTARFLLKRCSLHLVVLHLEQFQSFAGNDEALHLLSPGFFRWIFASNMVELGTNE